MFKTFELVFDCHINFSIASLCWLGEGFSVTQWSMSQLSRFKRAWFSCSSQYQNAFKVGLTLQGESQGHQKYPQTRPTKSSSIVKKAPLSLYTIPTPLQMSKQINENKMADIQLHR